MDAVTPTYFHVMDIVMLSGRSFTEGEMSGNPPVAIVSAETARRFWPDQAAVGQHIRLLDEETWRTVIGVTADVRAYDLKRTTPDWIKGTVYVPYGPTATAEDKRMPAEMTIAVRTSGDESQVRAMLQRIVAGLNHDVPVTEVQTMSAAVSEAAATPASTASLFVVFAGVALTLGVVGVYGVIAFLVSRRTREIGIRIALGAQRYEIVWLILKEGARFAALGITFGLAGAFVVTRWLSSELYGVSAVDPLTYTTVAAAMAVVTILACYVPARRAMRIDPMSALRYE